MRSAVSIVAALRVTGMCLVAAWIVVAAGPGAGTAEAAPPFQDVCQPRTLTVAKGAVPPGDQGSTPCQHVGGCICRYEKCLRTDPSKPAHPVVVAKHVDCTKPALASQGAVGPGCKVQNATVDPNKSWNGATCKSSDGCTCYVTVCLNGGVVTKKDAKCIGLPH